MQVASSVLAKDFYPSAPIDFFSVILKDNYHIIILFGRWQHLRSPPFYDSLRLNINILTMQLSAPWEVWGWGLQCGTSNVKFIPQHFQLNFQWCQRKGCDLAHPLLTWPAYQLPPHNYQCYLPSSLDRLISSLAMHSIGLFSSLAAWWQLVCERNSQCAILPNIHFPYFYLSAIPALYLWASCWWWAICRSPSNDTCMVADLLVYYNSFFKYSEKKIEEVLQLYIRFQFIKFIYFFVYPRGQKEIRQRIKSWVRVPSMKTSAKLLI